ncbi:hypothetical protein [Sphingomonas sp. M1-B02]|uniref:hypothetical protein n=1 Tax=Sphingomonas sp. M1-B02 TaxID=3114300 RepID=UPI0022404869|nr:hypothetical protein [Sphingomonas sp. S6-11]UZK65861.1 hypothetical protein OKW87_15325 [Sphingomonas sp. S6-11]
MLGEKPQPVAVGTVYFAFGEKKIAASFNRDKIYIGGVVYISAEEAWEPQFCPDPFPGSIRHCVTWISTSDWTVFLEDRLIVAEHDVHRITSVLGEAISQDDVRRALYYAAGLVPVGKLHLGDTWHSSIPGKCLAVAERLQLVGDLRRPHIESVLWWHSEPLITYLLLTCFDILGQSKGWMPFGNWLKSKKGGPDLALIGSTDPIGVADELHRQWLDRFGTRNSFYRFANERLDQPTRQRLLDSLEIIKYPLPPADGALSRGSEIPTTPEEKLRYLYKVRNSFTHEARGVPGKYPGVARQPKRGLGQAIEKGLFCNYATVNWPNVLIEVVKFGLLGVLHDQLAEAPQDLDVPEVLPNGPGRRSYA